MEIKLSVNKNKVFEQVQVSSSYNARKRVGDETAQFRMPVIDEDYEHLSSFFDDAKRAFCFFVKDFLVSEYEDSEGDYTIILNVSNAFDVSLTNSVNIGLFRYFVNSIISNWYLYTCKDEAPAYSQLANSCVEDIVIKLRKKRKPIRPEYD